MKVSISPPLLLLFVLFHCARAEDINWAECGDTAYCQEWLKPNCEDKTNVGMRLMYEGKQPQCNIGVYIKPDSTKKWTISIMNVKQKPAGTFSWKIGSKTLFTCTDNFASAGSGGQFRVTPISHRSTSDSALCVFTIETPGGNDKISELLKAMGDDQIELDFKSKLLMDIKYSAIDLKIRCKRDQLFTEDACDKETEDCSEELNDDWDCIDTTLYRSLFRKDKSIKDSEFVNATFSCEDGVFQYLEDEGDTYQDVGTNAQAKCARKKCSLCEAKENFKELFHNGTFYDCDMLKCKSSEIMQITNKGGEMFAIQPDKPVMCSHKTKIGENIEEKNARWVVEENEEFVIETAVCVNNTNICNVNNPMVTSCGEKNSTNCKNAIYDAKTQIYHCANGTEHISVEKHLETDTHIKSVKCNKTDGKWILTDMSKNTSIEIPKGEKITIKCLITPAVAAPKSSVDKGGFPVWIIILIVVFVLLTAGVVIATFFYRRGRKAKKGPPTATKTSSSSNASGKPPSTSSGEKEPLTSAMQSITGEGASLHTAIPTKPTPGPGTPAVVLAKADLRASTAVASDTSTKKEEKVPRKGEKIDTIPNFDDKDEKRRERTCHSDDSKRTGDVTSTKEKLAPLPTSTDDDKMSALKSQTGGDGESQVSTKKKNEESAKLLPKNKATPRKYSRSTTKASEKPKAPNKEFINLTDSSSNDEPSQTGSKRKLKKRK